jgi:hypothetical protein
MVKTLPAHIEHIVCTLPKAKGQCITTLADQYLYSSTKKVVAERIHTITREKCVSRKREDSTEENAISKTKQQLPYSCKSTRIKGNNADLFC